jgi:hypothetical protein
MPAPARANPSSDFIPASAPAAKIPTPLFAPAPSPRASSHTVSPVPVAPAASSGTIMMNMNNAPVEPVARASRLYPAVQRSKFAPAYVPAYAPTSGAQTP